MSLMRVPAQSCKATGSWMFFNRKLDVFYSDVFDRKLGEGTPYTIVILIKITLFVLPKRGYYLKYREIIPY